MYKLRFEVGPACIKTKTGYLCRKTPMNMSNQRMHWAVRSKWTKAWKNEVMNSIIIAKPLFTKDILKRLPLEKSSIKITLLKYRLMDHDGAYTSVKPVLDALKDNGIIVDDSPKYIDLKVDQIQISKKEEKENVIIEIIFN